LEIRDWWARCRCRADVVQIRCRYRPFWCRCGADLVQIAKGTFALISRRKGLFGALRGADWGQKYFFWRGRGKPLYTDFADWTDHGDWGEGGFFGMAGGKDIELSLPTPQAPGDCVTPPSPAGRGCLGRQRYDWPNTVPARRTRAGAKTDAKRRTPTAVGLGSSLLRMPASGLQPLVCPEPF
jgi:hypothetical protein